MGWMSLTSGLEYQHLVWEMPETGSEVEIHALRADPEVVRIRVLDARDFGAQRLTAREFAEQTGALAVINGGYFDTRDLPVGLVIRDGQLTSGLRRRDWGVFIVEDLRARIVSTRRYRRRKTIQQALQTGPRLVVGGRETTLQRTFRRRSALGLDRSGRVILLVALVSEGVPDMTLAELGAILRLSEAEGGLSLKDALSLDGGGSSQLFVSAGGSLLDIPGQWPVVTALGVFVAAEERPPVLEGPTIEQLPTEPAPTRPPRIFQPWE
jgi:exopolysaccharide biosynthesis protein